MRVINFVHDNAITIEAVGNGKSANVADDSKLTGATKGQGVLVFHYGASGRGMVSNWIKRFVMSEETPVDTLNPHFSDRLCRVELPDTDSCTGFVSSNMEGFIVAPAVLLKFRDGRDIVIMSLRPQKDRPSIALEKTVLLVSGGNVQAQVFLNVVEGVECSGAVSGTGFKDAHLIITRRPNCELIKDRFSETLVERKGPGTLTSSWIPVSRAFEDIVAVFRPTEIRDSDMEKFLELIGADDDAFLGQKSSSFIIGDGRGTSYTLSLVLDRSFRRDMMDETLIKLS